MNLCHLVAFNHFMAAGLRHGLNRGINREWHKMQTLAEPVHVQWTGSGRTSELTPPTGIFTNWS